MQLAVGGRVVGVVGGSSSSAYCCTCLESVSLQQQPQHSLLLLFLLFPFSCYLTHSQPILLFLLIIILLLLDRLLAPNCPALSPSHLVVSCLFHPQLWHRHLTCHRSDRHLATHTAQPCAEPAGNSQRIGSGLVLLSFDARAADANRTALQVPASVLPHIDRTTPRYTV